MSNTVDVSIETVADSQIQEVSLDGQEIYTQPLSMTEHLSRLAQKIDFSKDESVGKGKPTSEGDKETEEEKPITPFQPSLWPWDSVRNKLRAAQTEIGVLLDVLNIAKEKRYMVLDHVSEEGPESRAGLLLHAKKKSLASAAAILSNGAERLRKSQENLLKTGTPDFHQDLLRLRQNWRLKKVGNAILGDLSYKSAGSRFWQNGTFEVTKNDVDPTDPTSSPPAGQMSPKGSPPSALKVTVPSELEGVAYIWVSIKRDTDSTDLASVEFPMQNTSALSDVHYLQKLQCARTVIFCKEVFSQLAREAVQLKSKIPHVVVENQISSHLFPGIQLSIALCHYTEKDKKVSHQSNSANPQHNPVLELSLHQLLREAHFRNTFQPMPHPVTALLGMSKRRRLAGPHAFSRTELMDLSRNESLLEQIIKQARHFVVKERAITVIDEMARGIQDPQICVHWSNISSSLEVMIKVIITSSGYENVRTPFALHIGVDSMRSVCEDGRVIDMSCKEQELRDLVFCQIAQHHISTVENLSRMMGWKVLSVNTHVGVGDTESIGSAATIMLASPRGDRVLSIRSSPTNGMRVSVQKCPRTQDENNSNVVKDPRWSSLGGPFQSVHLDKLEGRNFVNKIELLMACLS